MIELNYPNVKQGLYLIDENGNIWSNYKKDYLSTQKDKDGYLKINLSGGSRSKKVYCRIATLVAWNFIGPPPKDLKDPTINHIDGNILNNNFKNLEWCERGTNSSIRKNKGEGEKNHESKLTEKEVKEICNLIIDTNLNYQQIADQFNISKSTVSSIVLKKNWKSITNNYDFSCRKVVRNSLGQFQSINTKFEVDSNE